MRPLYATLEQVKQAINMVAPPARTDAQILRVLGAASDHIDGGGGMRRTFWPQTETRYYDYLDHQYTLTWRLWLDAGELAGPPTLVLSNGQDITAGVLARNGDGDVQPPFGWLEQDLAGNAVFSSGATYQRAIAVTGPWGYRMDESAAGTLSQLTTTTQTAATLSDSSLVGVGSLIRVDAERMLVTAKGYADTTLTLTGNVAASATAQLIPLSAATVHLGETLMVDAEQMLVLAVAGLSAVVQRAVNGTALAAHVSTTAVYADRGVTLQRAAAGTAAATHAAAAPILTFDYPDLISTLAVAEALSRLGIERAGYTQVIERGSMTKISPDAQLLKDAQDTFRRKIFIRTAARSI